MEYIKKRALKYFYYDENGIASDIVPWHIVEDFANEIIDKKDKIIFLTTIVEENKKSIDNHVKICSKPQPCGTLDNYEDVTFEYKQKLLRYGVSFDGPYIFLCFPGDHPTFLYTYVKRHSMTRPSEDPITSLYRDSFPDFARMIRRMGGSLEEAKDTFHDALLIYMEREKAGKLNLHSSPKAYLLGTARICWLHTRGTGPISELPEGFEAAEPEDTNEEEREKSLLESLVRSGKKCMELLKAFYYDHCSMQDVADRFGFNGRRSATVQKYKCLEKVREEIKTTQAYAQ